ncbi:PREDICTED: dynamin-1-like protein [Rhagoletis zephyria]|uniref:dynamin-1-like protein n=1 Tax=Rhagoletis zephyria TaxID=28612 RepID=UPI0008119840|nr:PREDICTED: dynamin-1-like protein [Rhagoletis zephyria]
MESLVAVINKLQDVFYKVNLQKSQMIRLPQIVVIGSQSSGKSSVLEAIVGRDFLPRGSGIVTRCPLILQLQHVEKGNLSLRNANDGTSDLSEWGKFEHTGSKIYTDFDEIREEIITRTEEIAGENKGISSQAISLKIFSSKVVDLTLVDLPGMTKVAVGDQPADIEAQIEKLVYRFISSENSLILAVSPANADFANSDAIKAARKVDPSGDRTLAVLTKLDIMDTGTDATEVLSGGVIPVKLGIIGVVNRSQKDIKERKSIAKAKADEAAYLQANYPELAYRNGTTYLAKQLSQILHQHIAKCLPELRERVQQSINKCQASLNSYGAKITNQSTKVFAVLSSFQKDYCSAIEGGRNVPNTNELDCGARICYITHDVFTKSLEDPGLYKKMFPVEILNVIRNIQGIHSGLFIPQSVFEQLTKIQIKELTIPSLKCIEFVHNEMKKIALSQEHYSTKNDLTRFPKLAEQINSVVMQFLENRKKATEDFVNNLFKVELGYINVRHPDFYENSLQIVKLNNLELNQYNSINGIATSGHNFRASNSKTIKPKMETNDICYEASNNDRVLTDKDIHDCKIVEHLFNTYYKIVRKNIQDMVPKSIITFMVKYVQENLLTELVGQLNKPELFDFLLTESVHIARFRQETTDYLNVLKKAEKIINDVDAIQTL